MAEGEKRAGVFDFEKNKDAKEKVFMGILGAILFSLGGVAVWVLLWYVGFIAGLAGLLTVVLAVNGYKVLGKKLTKRGLIIAIIVAIVMIIFAWMISITIDVMQAFKEGYKAGEIDVMPTVLQAFAFGLITVFTNAKVAGSYILELVIGLALTALASFFYVKPLFKKLKEAEAENGPAGQTVVNDADAIDAASEGEGAEDTTEKNYLENNLEETLVNNIEETTEYILDGNNNDRTEVKNDEG
jgi:hypothetical protein